MTEYCYDYDVNIRITLKYARTPEDGKRMAERLMEYGMDYCSYKVQNIKLNPEPVEKHEI
jgi:hypothetical protein